jgi:OmpA-OmpF porin, OOP family
MKKGHLPVIWLATFLLNFSIYTPVFAQNWEVGTTLGGSMYNGDIDVSPRTALHVARFGGGIFARYHINPFLRLRLQANAGKLYADEINFPTSIWKARRGFSFTSPIYELALLPEIRPIRWGKLELFGFAGIAGAAFNPTAQYNEPNPLSRDIPKFPELIDADKKATFRHATLSMPIGGGFQWFINDRFAIGAEAGGRKTFSDYFDQISVSAGATSKDFYFFGGITVSYFFGSGNGFSGDWSQNGGKRGGGVSCPTFK